LGNNRVANIGQRCELQFFFGSGDPNLHGNRVLNSVSVATSGSFKLTGGAGDTLTLASGNFSQLAGAAASGPHLVNVPVAIQADGFWKTAGMPSIRRQ
jgi:hypothetical protein